MAQKRKKTQVKKKKAAPKAKSKTAKLLRKTAHKSVRKAPPKKAALKKAAPKKSVAKKPAKKPVAKKAALKKPAAKKIVVKKVAVKKAPQKKVAVTQVQKSTAPFKPAVGGLSGELYQAAVRVLEDRQAEEVVSYNLAGRSSMADYVIIASGRASRQIAAIADYLRDAFTKLGARQVRVEGLPEANWVLVDAGDIVVHLFRPEVRQYYKLEDIWSATGKDTKKIAFTNK